MTETYQPGEGDIAELLARYSARELAIGYLRARRAAKAAQASAEVSLALSEISMTLAREVVEQ